MRNSTHTDNQSLPLIGYIKRIFTLIILLSIFSCGETYDVPDDMTTSNEIVLRNNTCGPEGSCTVEGTPIYTFIQAQCTLTVQMKITKCTDNGELAYYFEDEGMPINVQGTCTNLDDQIEEAYEAFITFHMLQLNNTFPDCQSGSIVSSKQIKNECTRLCPAPGNPGENNVWWVSCADEQGCCIETIEWCDDNGTVTPSDAEYTDNTIGCIASTLNCEGDPIGFGVLEPCGGRCDR